VDLLIGGGERANGETGQDGDGDGDQFAHVEIRFLALIEESAGKDRHGGRAEVAVQRLHEGDEVGLFL
jgi:hypothetical protein